MNEIAKPNYEQLITNIGSVLTEGRNRVATAINTALVQSYWTIGQHIVEYEQQGSERAEYGSNLLDRLVKDLRERYGVGFSRSNIHYMRKLYIAFPKVQTLSELLSWSHYVEILKGDDPLEISFYAAQCATDLARGYALAGLRGETLSEKNSLSCFSLRPAT